MGMLFRDVAGPCLAPHGSVVCIGAFDGVHRGHRAVLDCARERAANLGLTCVAISFAPIPRVFFARGVAVPQLSSAREKIAALIDAGMQRVLLLHFDAALAAMSAEDFVARVLVARLRACAVWVGEGFHFGHARAGDFALLQRLGQVHGFRAEIAPTFALDGERVSSSRIRALLVAGDFDAAARLLGRRFAIGGHVVRGQQLGRKLGYPTANLRLGSRTAPVGGIFAVRVHGRGDALARCVEAHRAQSRAPEAGSEGPGCFARPWTAELSNSRRGEAEPLFEGWPGVASLGVRPTVNGTEPLLEAHLFDFDGDLYGKRIEVEFVQKLREEEKFFDLAAMVQQIHRDAAQARNIFGIAAGAAAGATL